MAQNDSSIPSNEIFGTSHRLTIMILLYTHKKISFTNLQKLLDITPGNLGHHLKKLEHIEYITMYKAFSPFKPITMIKITSVGLSKFKSFILSLKGLIDNLDIEKNK